MRAGRRFVVHPTLHNPRNQPIRGLWVDLVGVGIVTSQSQYGNSEQSEPFCVARVEVLGRGELAAGDHRFDAAFEIPEKYPPSYGGGYLRIEWEIRVRVGIPWWVDARSRFTIQVAAAAEFSPPPPPPQRVWASRPEGPLPRKPHVELSLGTTAVLPGGMLHGAIAFANVEFNDYRGVKLSLVAVERSGAGMFTQTRSFQFRTWALPLEDPGENEPIRFSLKTPDAVIPAFDLERWSVKWFLEVTVDIAWKVDQRLWVALTILPPREQPEPDVQSTPLAVGRDRMEQLWLRAARATGFAYVDGCLRRDHGDVAVEIRRDDRGRKGSLVVAELRLPNLRLGLRWTAGSGLQGRSDTQTKPLRNAIGKLLEDLAPASVSDDAIIVERRDAARSLDPLVTLGERVDALASALSREIPNLRPPAGGEALAERLETEARRLGARVFPSGLELRGERAAARFVVRGAAAGSNDEPFAPTRIDVRVRPGVTIPTRYQGRWSKAPTSDVPDADTPAAALLAEAMVVEIEATSIAAAVSIDDVDAAFSTLERMLAEAERLAGQAGPYR